MSFKYINNFKFWCQKVLPLVYDDSLSYYEMLSKMAECLNDVIDNVNSLPEYIQSLVTDASLKNVLSELLDELREQIATLNEEDSTTATSNSEAGTFVWIDGLLYKTIRQILSGDKYVVGSNIEKITVEEEINKIVESIQTQLDALNNTATKLNNNLIFITDFGAVGDGVTDDTVAINNAIKAANNYGGGCVIVPNNGTFVFTAIELLSNVTLTSLGGVLKLKDNTCNSSSTAYYPILAYQRDNVHIKNLIVDGNGANNTLFEVADAITLSACSNSSVENCIINDAPDSGIMFSNTLNSKVIFNVINNAPDCGIYINTGQASSGSVNPGTRNITFGNIITNSGVTGISLKRNTINHIVSSNIIDGGVNGITFEIAGLGGYSTNCTVTNNRVSNTSEIGISLRYSQQCIITNNRVENFTGVGLSADGISSYNTVTNNVFTSAENNVIGIRLKDYNNYLPQNNNIANNIIQLSGSSAIGISLSHIAETPSAQGNYNSICNNMITATSGIEISNFFNTCSICNNICTSISLNSQTCTLCNNTGSLTAANTILYYTVNNGLQKIGSYYTEPDIGDWKVGDICLNRTATSGTNLAWIYNGSSWVALNM